MARQLQGFSNLAATDPSSQGLSSYVASQELPGYAPAPSQKQHGGHNKAPGGASYGAYPTRSSSVKTAKLTAEKAQQRVQRLLKDFRHGVIRFEGAGSEARFLLPPHGLEDPSLILRAMVESGLWGLELPTVIFQCDDLLYGGPGENGGYYMQAKGCEPEPVDWRWNQAHWQKLLGFVAPGDMTNAAAKMHKDRMSVVAQCCHTTAVELGQTPWFFSSAPCIGGGDGGNMVADYLEQAAEAPVFVGAPSPSQGLFDEEGFGEISLQGMRQGVAEVKANIKETVQDAVENVTSNRKEHQDRLLPFILQACPDDDLQQYAVRLTETPNTKFVYPEMTSKLCCEKASNLRWLNPGVSHYVFFRKSQAKLHQGFEQLMEMRLCSTVRLVAGSANTPEYGRYLFEHARRRKGSLTVLLDKSAPMATRLAAGLKQKGHGDTPRSSQSQQGSPTGFGWLMPSDQLLRSQAPMQPGQGPVGGAIYDVSPIEVPHDVESSFQVVPFLEDASEQALMTRLSEVLHHRLPLINRHRDVEHEPQAEKVAKTWELATKLVIGAERRERRFKWMLAGAVWTLVLGVCYSLLFAYDMDSEPRPCEAMYAPIHWTRRAWVTQCEISGLMRFVMAVVPFITMAITMKLCMPTSLQHSKQAVWLRSAAREAVREIYRYRVGLGDYGKPIHRWISSPATLTPPSDDFGTQSTHATFDEFVGGVVERVRLNTGIIADTLITPTDKDIARFKESVIGSYVPPPLAPANESLPSTPRSGFAASTHAPLIANNSKMTMTQVEAEEGMCRMNEEMYLRHRLHGQHDHLVAKRNRMKCEYELYWAFMVVWTVAAGVFCYVRMNLTMICAMAILSGAMVLCELGEVPLRLKTTSAVVQVLEDYLDQWDELSEREKHSPAKFQAMVNGVEELLLLEDPFYLDDHQSLRGRNLYDGQLIEIPDELDKPQLLHEVHRAAQRFSGPRTGARGENPRAPAKEA